MGFSNLLVTFILIFAGFFLYTNYANAQSVDPDFYNDTDDFITLTLPEANYYISYEPDGTVANGGGGFTEDRICQVYGDCANDGSGNISPEDGWRFSTTTEDFHIVTVIDSVDYTICSSTDYDTCVNDVTVFVIDDYLITYEVQATSSTSTPPTATTSTTTINVDFSDVVFLQIIQIFLLFFFFFALIFSIFKKTK